MDVKSMFGLNLPEQVPHFGFQEPYIIGNGLVMSGGSSENGMWDYSTGLGYGGIYSHFKRERVKFYINGRPFTLQGEMHRAAGTGIFYSTQQFKDAAACLVDFAIQGQPFTARLMAIKNTSDKDIVIHPYAEIKFPREGYVLGKSDVALHMVQNNKSWMSASFGGGQTNVRYYINFFRAEAILECPDVTLAPGEVKYYTLYHDMCICELPADAKQYTVQDATVYEIPFEHLDRTNNDGRGLLQESIDEWLAWTAKGMDLSFIKDERSRQVVESVTVIERMLQDIDGGVMATPRVYTACYVRDAFSAMKGMLAAQRYDEVKKFLTFQKNVYIRRTSVGEFGVPCSTAMMGGDGIFFGFGDVDNWSCESPGLCVVLMRDYYRATGDLEFIKSLEDFMRYCIDVQLTHAEKLNWRMYFNNDETESQGCGFVLREIVDFEQMWTSMTSSTMCMSSTQFFVDYLKLTNGDYAEYEEKLNKVRDAMEETYWNEEKGIYEWFKTPDGKWPETLIPNYQITPLYLDAPVKKERAISSAKEMIKYWNRETGFIANQVYNDNEDFCGHNLGYLLYMATALKLEEEDAIYDALVNGASISAFGMWCEAYYDDGTPYQAPTTGDMRMHNFRCFESGTNLEAIINYWKAKK